MEETVLFPSPSWFLVSILGASEDGWLVYGGPGKTFLVLEPVSSEYDGVIESDHRYKTHLVTKAHKDRVICVDMSPEWPEKRHFVTGSIDGTVKEWKISQNDGVWNIKSTVSQETQLKEKEELVGVGYSMGTHVISVGNFSTIVVWDLNSNVITKYDSYMKNFRATCMRCSPHMPFVVAVGTKQGVAFVMELKGKGRLFYKVRGQDDEILNLSWCPQFEVTLQRAENEPVRKSGLAQRLERIQNEPGPELDDSGIDKNLPNDSFDESVVEEDDTFDIYKDHEANEFGHKKYEPENILVKVKDNSKKVDFLAECEKLKAQILKNKNEDEESIQSLVEAMDKAQVEESPDSKISANVVPEPSTTVSGTAAFVPETAREVPGSSKNTLIDAISHKHLLASIGKQGNIRIWSQTGKSLAFCTMSVYQKKKPHSQYQSKPTPNNASLVWHTADKLLITDGKSQLFECNPLAIDGKNRLTYSPLHSQHRRGAHFVTSSAPRAQPGAPLAGGRRWHAWSVGQDRFLIKYCLSTRQVVAKFGTCGGFLYDMQFCPYDEGKLAVSVGDGAIRVWDTQTTEEKDDKLLPGDVCCFWYNVQGKVLQCAWHPEKENLLAFSTAESRVGLIDTCHSKMEKPAKVLLPDLASAVYSIAWGDNMALFAVGGGKLVMYQANKPDEAPIPIKIEIEGQKWEPSIVVYNHHGLSVGSSLGGVAIFSGPGGLALAAKYVFSKSVYSMEWHPQQVTSSNDDSQYMNLLALSAADRLNTIVILNYTDKEGGGKQLENFNRLTGHTDNILKMSWSPHHDGRLLSTSQDATARVWDAINGVCLSIFAGHRSTVMSALWFALPTLPNHVLSGGTDCALRLWDWRDYPAEKYTVVVREPKKRKTRPNKSKKVFGIVEDEKKDENVAADVAIEVATESATEEATESTTEVATEMATDAATESATESATAPEVNTDNQEKRTFILENTELLSDAELDSLVERVMQLKFKKFLLPLLTKQVCTLNMHGARAMIMAYFEKNTDVANLLTVLKGEDSEMYDFIKLFGTINEVNEVIDKECKNHLVHGRYEAYIMVLLFRGHIDAAIQFANEHDVLDPFLLCIAPCVSFKYWKDITNMYAAQLERLEATNKEMKLYLPKWYGGIHYHKVAAYLTVHNVRRAVEVLVTAKLFKEAYVLCRCRHMDSFAEELLNQWSYDAGFSGNIMLSALIKIAAGNITGAVSVLRRSKEQACLELAAELAKSVGLNIFADYIETQKNVGKKPVDDQTEALLGELPTRMELLLKDNKNQNAMTEHVKENKDQNGMAGHVNEKENKDKNAMAEHVNEVVKENGCVHSECDVSENVK